MGVICHVIILFFNIYFITVDAIVHIDNDFLLLLLVSNITYSLLSTCLISNVYLSPCLCTLFHSFFLSLSLFFFSLPLKFISSQFHFSNSSFPLLIVVLLISSSLHIYFSSLLFSIYISHLFFSPYIFLISSFVHLAV